MEYKIINNPNEFSGLLTRETIAGFLFEHLEQYGDKLEDIKRCIDYAMSDEKGMGGFILAGYEDDKISGVVIINKTAMHGYIPGNLLVYIAVHGGFRGRGVGKELMQQTIDNTDGDIALHVEADNPAVKLYEKVGFENKYLEMRYTRK